MNNNNNNDQAVILVGGKPYVPKGTGVDTWIMEDPECVPREESTHQPTLGESLPKLVLGESLPKLVCVSRDVTVTAAQMLLHGKKRKDICEYLSKELGYCVESVGINYLENPQTTYLYIRTDTGDQVKFNLHKRLTVDYNGQAQEEEISTPLIPTSVVASYTDTQPEEWVIKEWIPKVGDWVQVKEWDDLIKNLVEVSGAYKSVSYRICFIPNMKEFCGGKYTIATLLKGGIFTLDIPDLYIKWKFCKDFVIPCNPPSPTQEESFKVGQRVRVKSREEVSKHQAALNRMSFDSIRTIINVLDYGIDLGDGYIYDKDSLLLLREGMEKSISNDSDNPFHEFSTDALRQAITIIKLIKDKCFPITISDTAAMIQSEINRRLSKGENQ